MRLEIKGSKRFNVVRLFFSSTVGGDVPRARSNVHRDLPPTFRFSASHCKDPRGVGSMIQHGCADGGGVVGYQRLVRSNLTQHQG
jgi:hypothetical protein